MQITPATPVVVAKIAGVEGVSIAAPYAAGHVLTDGEAAALNQTLRENISNQLRKQITDGKLDAEGKPTGAPFSLEEVQALVSAKVAEYEFGVRSTGTREASDPVGAEAKKILRQMVTERLKQAGKKMEKDALAAQIQTIYDADPTKWRKLAEDALSARQKALKGASLDGLNI